MPQLFAKDPQADLDYSIDWSDWLADAETISTSTWAAATGLTVEASPAPSVAGGVTTVWLSGGTLGQSYAVVNTIVTSQGRTDERTITIRVANK